MKLNQVIACALCVCVSGAAKRLRPASGAGVLDLGARAPELPSIWHTTQGIHAELVALAQSCQGLNMRTEKRTDSKGREVAIDVLTLKSAAAQPRNKFFLLFGEHARELISAESGLHFVKQMCSGSARAAAVLQNSEIQMIVNANPGSRQKVEQGDWCRRVNPNGVDLNRNWDEHWQAGAEMEDTNPGPSAFSEIETQILRDTVKAYNPTSFLTIHSGTRGMYMPWAFNRERETRRNRQQMLDIITAIDKTHCQCPFGGAGKEVGYACPGTCLDWVFDKLQTPYAFAFEIYVGFDRDADLKSRWEAKMASFPTFLQVNQTNLADQHFKDLFTEHPSSFVQVQSSEGENGLMVSGFDCFKLFNPDTPQKLKATLENWSAAYMDLADMVAKKLA